MQALFENKSAAVSSIFFLFLLAAHTYTASQVTSPVQHIFESPLEKL